MKNSLLENGSPAFVIVANTDSAQSQYAARELRYYFGMMTGKVFEIVSADAPVEKTMKRLILNQVTDASLGDDGFCLQPSETAFTITGGIRGVIYGSYELLERMGCRFFTPRDEKVPYDPAVVLPDEEIRQVPILEYRLHNTIDFERYQKFSVKQRINGVTIKEKFGGSMRYAWFVHSMDQVIPQKEFGKTHPEYFSMRDGKRYVPENPLLGQRCLTNPDVLKIAIERVRAALKSHPECRIISISQMDNCCNCTCPECAKVDQEEGSSSGTMIRFINAIATALKDEFPQVIFDTLAYQYTRPAPTKTRPVENVCVRLCSIECCFSHPMESCDDTTRGVEHPDGTHSSFVTDLQDWGKMCNRMYIWDYVTCFSHYPTPHPNWHTLQPNMQMFVKNHAKGVFEQGNSKLGGGPDLIELRQYIIAKLLWDPYCDVEKHITEFLDYYYGKAAQYVREYIETICEKCEKDNIHVGFNDAPVQDFVSEEMLSVYEAILNKAEKAVQDDPVKWIRIKRIQFCPWYLRLKRRAKLEGKIDAEELNRFFTEWRSYGFTRIHEWVDAEFAHQAFLRDMWRGEEMLNHWTAEAEEIL